VPRLPTVVREHLPGRALDARRRELVSAVVTGSAGADLLARLHSSWHDVLGPAELSEVDDELLVWVANAIGPAPRLDLDALPADLSPAWREAGAATVIHGVVTAVAIDRVASLARRLGGSVPLSPAGFAGDAVAVLLSLPVTVPVLTAGLVADLVGRVAPAPAVLEVDDDANLLVQLLAETLPTWLGSAWGRVLVAALPVEVPVAVRSGLSGATVRLGLGRVRVVNGVADDAWALFDGEIDGLLRAGTHSLSRELRAARLRG
jgi:hypothetical protein